MWSDVKQRLIAILQCMDKPAGTNDNVAVSTPQTRSDFHGYLIVVKPNRDAVQAPTTAEKRTHVLTFSIECTSPQVNTSLPVPQEYYIEAYADAITAHLERFPRLEEPNTRVGLTGVSNTFVSGAVFQSPTRYAETSHYGVIVTLQITFSRATGC